MKMMSKKKTLKTTAQILSLLIYKITADIGEAEKLLKRFK